ncbi:hypothetical protein FB45DRAFT_886532 [Roridomyces roridus]|uniref:AAA-ATPase-like domain-containing protein n=1 Tax=Roridomyces roridus TaxID=1738132 RepID=A0AAD7G0U2_9AGAR|nr:hypothetical protein FB45DRAFT_886532 [Roridomyces roridus]
MSIAIVDPSDPQYEELLAQPSERVKTPENKVENTTFMFELSDDEDDESPDVRFSTTSSPSTASSSSKRRSEDDGSSDCEYRHKRVKKSRGSSASCSSDPLHLPRLVDDFNDFCDTPQTAFVDKTRVLFQLPTQFRYLLLRPPKFGKTVFLSAMSQFYDVHSARRFHEYFESPESPSSDHNQHLCLSLTFWNLPVDITAEDFAEQLRSNLWISAKFFLVKYARELGLTAPQSHLAHEEVNPLSKLFDLVKSSGKTLFVGVDSYDASLLETIFSPIGDSDTQQGCATTEDFARIFDEQLWGPLQEAADDIVPKLLVTGTLSLQTPMLRKLLVAAPTYLQSCCGFTVDQALDFASSIPHEPQLDVAEIRAKCGDYLFSPDEGIGEPVIHPQVLIDRIAQLTSEPSEGEPFRLLSSLFDLLPFESDVPNVVTIEGLIELVVSGVVEIEPTELHAGRDLEGTSVFWSALYRAGALTRVRGSESTFRVAGGEALSWIHSRIDQLVHNRYYDFKDGDKEHHFLGALLMYQQTPQPLVDLLSKVLRDQTQHCLGKAKEPSLPGILELTMCNAQLISSSKFPEHILTPPPDASYARVYGYSTDSILRWELTTLTLLGFWRAANLNDGEPSVEALRALHEELCQEDEEKLLARQYSVWSDSLQAMETRAVETFFNPESVYTQLIAVGGARILRREGPEEVLPLPPRKEEEVDDQLDDQDEDDSFYE